MVISACTEIIATRRRFPVQRSTNGSSQIATIPTAMIETWNPGDGSDLTRKATIGPAGRPDGMREDKDARSPKVGLTAPALLGDEPVDERERFGQHLAEAYGQPNLVRPTSLKRMKNVLSVRGSLAFWATAPAQSKG